MHNNDERKEKQLRTDDEMMRKILRRECGTRDIDEYAADELELENHRGNEEFAADNPPMGKSEYFSTCEFTMIDTDDDTVNFQGS